MISPEKFCAARSNLLPAGMLGSVNPQVCLYMPDFKSNKPVLVDQSEIAKCALQCLDL